MISGRPQVLTRGLQVQYEAAGQNGGGFDFNF
jgi:hypothetical protein